MQIQGHYELQFEAVREAFAALFDDPQERGAALCVQIGGQTVLDLWAGTADKDGAEAWHSDTIANLFSCTKTFTAVTALQLVAEGKLQLDAPVANYWPEFAAAGKHNITLRQLLCHKAGLPALRDILPAEALYDWPLMTTALAAETPGGHPAKAMAMRPSLMAGWSVNCCAAPMGVGRGSRLWRGLPGHWAWTSMSGWRTRNFIVSPTLPGAKAIWGMRQPNGCYRSPCVSPKQ